jgi:hypothetical protein
MNMKAMFLPLLCFVFGASAALAPSAGAQQTNETKLESPNPVITGDWNFQTTFQPSTKFEPSMKTLMPEFDPVVLVPIGNELLIEAEYDMSSNLTDISGKWGPAVVAHGLEYAQLNYIVTPNLALTAGRFLTPFGIFRERYHPMWIRNVAADPLIFPMNNNSSNGEMARGAVRLSEDANLTYAGYFSALTRNNQVQADRRAGTRVSLFFPNKRVEIGASYARVLSDTHVNMIGGDLSWNMKTMPLDLRAEYEQTSELGKGYWLEAAYHLNRMSRNAFFRNSLVALRQEQYWAPSAIQIPIAQSLAAGLPDRNTTAPTLGWTYTMYNGIRFDASYGRNFAQAQNHNIWTVGLTYRFAIF